MSKTALWSFLAAVSLALVVVTNFTYNNSPSMPVGLYRPTHEPWERGSLVLLKMPIKRIAALPGDHVEMTPAGIYREGRLIPNTAPVAGLPHCPFGHYTVPADMFLALGEVPDSWDGRYICFLPESLIASTTKPVWTKGAAQ